MLHVFGMFTYMFHKYEPKVGKHSSREHLEYIE